MRAFCVGLAALVYFSAASAHAEFFYVDSDNSILKVDSSGNVSVFAYIPMQLSGLALDSSGNLYISSGNTIVKFDPNGNRSIFADTDLNNPSGLAFDSSGNLYVANAGDNTIARFDANGNGSIFANSGLYGPLNLAFDPSGDLYVVNNGPTPTSPYGSVEKFDPSGNGTLFADGPRGPLGIAVDTNGDLFVGMMVPDAIGEWDPNGNYTLFCFGGPPDPQEDPNLWIDPSGLAFDKSGNLFVVNYDWGTIGEFETNGNYAVVASGLGYPLSIVVDDIPEPSTWSLLAFGAFTLLSVCRVRRVFARTAGDLVKSAGTRQTARRTTR
jgi:sugar lactone lactonase YvrE